jgi:hypothetical protein
MFILHVKHYFFQEILKVHSLQKKSRVSILLRLLPANYKIFEVPVLVFARASGNAVSAVRPWDRGCSRARANIAIIAKIAHFQTAITLRFYGVNSCFKVSI